MSIHLMGIRSEIVPLGEYGIEQKKMVTATEQKGEQSKRQQFTI